MSLGNGGCRGYWWRGFAMAVLAHLLTAAAPAGASNVASGPAADSATDSHGAFKICRDQTYALCAVSSCFVINNVSYCACDVKKGDSISLPFEYGTGKNVCSVNAEGVGNGFMVSTYSLPKSVVKPRGNQALYTCPAATSTGAYAQCDGGLCFRSTQGQNFPGSAKPLKPNQIICSCPITVADPTTAKIGYQIAGPYPCQSSFFKNCDSKVANTDSGGKIYVGSPTGSARLLTRLLYGGVPLLNRCEPPTIP